MNRKTDPALIKQAIADAFQAWLVEHSIAFPTLLEETIEQTVGEVFELWLENHSTRIIAAIVRQQSAKRFPKPAFTGAAMHASQDDLEA